MSENWDGSAEILNRCTVSGQKLNMEVENEWVLKAVGNV